MFIQPAPAVLPSPIVPESAANALVKLIQFVELLSPLSLAVPDHQSDGERPAAARDMLILPSSMSAQSVAIVLLLNVNAMAGGTLIFEIVSKASIEMKACTLG